MNFQIREAITANIKGESAEGIREIVEDAIERGDEHLLPGLGVFFEKWWQNAEKTEQDAVLNKLSQLFH